MNRKTLFLFCAIIIALAFAALFNYGVTQKQYQVVLGNEIAKTGYCIIALGGDADRIVDHLDIAPCDAQSIVYEPDPLFYQKDPLPEGTMRGYTLRRGILNVLPDGMGLSLIDGNMDERTAIVTVQKMYS